MDSSKEKRECRIGVLGAADGWYVKDLMRAASERRGKPKIEIEPLSFAGLSASMLSGRLARARAESENVDLLELDALLVRTMPLGSVEQIVFRMNALHVAEASGVVIRNRPRCLEIAIDKWLTLDVARRAGLEIPRTIACQTREAGIAAWEELGGDCVVKPLFGGEGRGIVRVTDRDMAWRVFSTLEQIQAVLYVQEFLPSRGFDLRLLVIGEEVLCVKRANGEDWRTNVSRGGFAEPHEPSFEQVSIAYRAAKAVGGWMVGVEVLETVEGRNVLLEVNAVPGWKATAAALNTDVASLLLERVTNEFTTGLNQGT